MNILEILNTRVPITWSIIKSHEHRGAFSFDGDDYEIQIDEFETNDGISLADVGFTKNGKITISDSGGKAASILGVITNGVADKLAELKPDVVMVGVSKGSGHEANRRSLYDAIIKWISRKTKYSLFSGWVEGSKGFFQLLSTKPLTNEQEALFTAEITRQRFNK